MSLVIPEYRNTDTPETSPGDELTSPSERPLYKAMDTIQGNVIHHKLFRLKLMGSPWAINEFRICHICLVNISLTFHALYMRLLFRLTMNIIIELILLKITQSINDQYFKRHVSHTKYYITRFLIP